MTSRSKYMFLIERGEGEASVVMEDGEASGAVSEPKQELKTR